MKKIHKRMLPILILYSVIMNITTGPVYGQFSEFKITASDGVVADRFGFSVSISGDYVIVGTSYEDFFSFVVGSAYIFKRNGASWMQEAKIFASDGAEGDQFGFSVSISGDYAVIGASRNSEIAIDAGSAYIFKRSDTTWTQEVILLPSDGAEGDLFGGSVSISGDYIVVGASRNDEIAFNAGSAYIYSDFMVDIENEIGELLKTIKLEQNHPNPFNPETLIEYSLPTQSNVNLIIYNLRGQEMVSLINENKSAGNHQVRWDASNFASGIYFYRLQAGDFVQTRKMLLLK